MATLSSDNTRLDAAAVIQRLEECGRTLLALPAGGYSTRMRSFNLEVVRSAVEANGWEGGKLRPSIPSAGHITRMDDALRWVQLIPQDRYVLRRIVGARSLVSPLNDKHLFPWRRLGTMLGADHKAIQRWHAQGIDLIVAGLNGIAPGQMKRAERVGATLM